MPPALSRRCYKPLRVRTSGDAKQQSAPSNKLIWMPPELQDCNDRAGQQTRSSEPERPLPVRMLACTPAVSDYSRSGHSSGTFHAQNIDLHSAEPIDKAQHSASDSVHSSNPVNPVNPVKEHTCG